jgi:uncharacterized protein DUF551
VSAPTIAEQVAAVREIVIRYGLADHDAPDHLYVAMCSILAALEAKQWRPIESAPKDGTKIDVWQRDHRRTEVYWSDIQEAWAVDGAYGPEEPTPLPIIPRVSHWMPLPSAPPQEG